MNEVTEVPGRRGRRAPIAAIAGLALAVFAPAVAQASVSVSITDGNRIFVVGDAMYDNVAVADQTNPACPGGSPCYEVKSFYDPVVASAPCVVSSPPSQYTGTVLCPSAGTGSGVSGITVLGREYEDRLLISDFVFGLGVPATLMGGSGEDHLTGSAQPDVLTGEEDDDEIRGGGGNDVLNGNPGHDSLYGAKGKDRLTGGPGPDLLYGGLGADLLFGSAGKDLLNGGAAKDACHGGKARDTARQCEKRTGIP
jgi:hypothetical protein